MTKKLILLMLVNVLGIALYAQTKDEKAVEKAVENLRQAMVDGNKSVLENLAATELSYGHSSGKIEEKASFVESLSSGKSDFVSIQLTEQTIKVINDVALVRHTLSGETNDNNKPNTVKLGVLLVWQKQKDQWKLIARQAFKFPVNP